MPAFNEEDNIVEAVQRASRIAGELAYEWELVVVDDGSTDQTAARLKSLLLRNRHLRLIRHPTNLGYGATLRDGFRMAAGELIFYTDSDLQFDVDQLRDFIPLIATSDLAVGFRMHRQDPALRCVLAWGYNRLVRLMFGVQVRDVDCSFKLFRREVLEKLDLESSDFLIDAEILAKARQWNFRLVERGVRHYARPAGQSKVRAGHIPCTLLSMARIWRRLWLPSIGEAAAPRRRLPTAGGSSGAALERDARRRSTRAHSRGNRAA